MESSISLRFQRAILLFNVPPSITFKKLERVKSIFHDIENMMSIMFNKCNNDIVKEDTLFFFDRRVFNDVVFINDKREGITLAPKSSSAIYYINGKIKRCYEYIKNNRLYYIYEDDKITFYINDIKCAEGSIGEWYKVFRFIGDKEIIIRHCDAKTKTFIINDETFELCPSEKVFIRYTLLIK